MDKGHIMKIFKEESRRIVQKGNTADLKLKLLQTTERLVRSFDYELPKAHSIKEKIKKIVKRSIRKTTRFITKPYAEKMLAFQECICELQGMYIHKYDDIYAQLKELSRRQKELEDKWIKKEGQESE